jgi:hypothetical protein
MDLKAGKSAGSRSEVNRKILEVRMAVFKSLALVGALVAVSLATPSAVQAEVLSYKDAKSQMFAAKPKKTKALVSATATDQFKQMMGAIGKLAAADPRFTYYGAVAISLSQGIAGTAATFAGGFHSVADASNIALAGCNKKRKSSEKKCEIIAEVVPSQYDEPRDFQLNMIASAAFGKEYRRTKGSKAFATSASTGEWGFVGKAESIEAASEAALTVCNKSAAKKGDADCVVVAAD